MADLGRPSSGVVSTTRDINASAILALPSTAGRSLEIIEVVVLHDTVAQSGVTLHIDTDTVVVIGTVLDGEAIPGHRRAFGEAVRLVEHTPHVLTVEDGGVRRKVTLREIESLRFVARKSAIRIHPFYHRESLIGSSVAIVCACGHPYIRAVGLGDKEGINDGGDGILPTVANLQSGTLLCHIDDIAVLGQCDACVFRLIASQVDNILLDSVIAGQVGGTGDGVVTTVHTRRNVRQPPVGIVRTVECTHGIRRLNEVRIEWITPSVFRQEGNDILTYHTTFHSGMVARSIIENVGNLTIVAVAPDDAVHYIGQVGSGGGGRPHKSCT